MQKGRDMFAELKEVYEVFAKGKGRRQWGSEGLRSIWRPDHWAE